MCEVTILHLFYKWTTNELYVSSFNNSWSHLPQEFDLQCKQDSDQSSAIYWDSNSGQKNRWRPNLRSEKIKNYNSAIVSSILLKFFPRIIHAYEQNSARNLNCKISWPQLINWWSLIGEWGVKSVTTHYSKAKLFQEAMFFIMIFTHPKKIYVS